MKTLNVVLIKPSKYGRDEYVERFRRGYLPNATLQHILSMTPSNIEGVETKITAIDEYVHTDLEYLKLLRRNTEGQTLVALVGVQSHQFHRALDLAALAVDNGCLAVLGGPHVMTNNTSMLQGTGVSFALSEAENVWPTILNDAVRGELQPVYGAAQRWARKLPEIIVQPPLKSDLRRYLAPIVGLYPARGCPFTCSFCSVIKIAGRMVRSQSIEATIASLVAAKAAGVRFIIFCSDNFNKYSEVTQLLEAMISERLGLRFFCQCDVQISRQPELVELLARAGCFQIFVGVESFNRKTLLAAHKAQNHPEQYRTIAQLCRQHNIALHCSNILGFPSDTAQEVLEHLEYLKELRPTLASFYILTPIPGTEQYDDFRSQGLIYERNLDRFDGTRPTWHHPRLSPPELIHLFQECYRRFYTGWHVRDLLGEFERRLAKKNFALASLAASLSYTLYARWAAYKENHPMAGGLWGVKLDHVSEYLAARKQRFGYVHVPLPASLNLSAAEQRINNSINIPLPEPVLQT